MFTQRILLIIGLLGTAVVVPAQQSAHPGRLAGLTTRLEAEPDQRQLIRN